MFCKTGNENPMFARSCEVVPDATRDRDSSWPSAMCLSRCLAATMRGPSRNRMSHTRTHMDALKKARDDVRRQEESGAASVRGGGVCTVGFLKLVVGIILMIF